MEQKKIHILLVEDEDDHAELVRRAFADNDKQVSLLVVSNIFEAKAGLTEFTPHIVIADLFLPDGRGTELLPADKNEPKYPLIIMTSQGNEQFAVEAMKGGAFDYVVKSEESLSSMPSIVIRVLREWENVIKKMQAHNELENRVKKRTMELKRKKIALSEILGQLEIEKKRLREAVQSNTEKIIFPLLNRFRRDRPSADIKFLDLLEENLKELTSEFGIKISDPQFKLTPKEIEICDMIKGGLSSKEIANLLNVSPGTIESHRFKIRNKLGLANTDTNLTSYLQKL